jgi:hypothetical protein
MKKLLLSITMLSTAFAANLNAQTLTNGNFEGAFTEFSTFPGNYDIDGFTNGWLNAPETTAPHAGLKSLKLTTSVDAALNSALSWGDPEDKLTGFVSYVYKGVIADPSELNLDFWYKNTSVGTDSSYVGMMVYDTVGTTTAADDKVLYFAELMLTTTTANWTNETFTMTQNTNAGVPVTGTANKFEIYAVSSTRGFWDYNTPTVGETLWLDDLVLANTASVKNVTANEFKISPNPATDVVNVSLKNNGEVITLTSAEGKVIETRVANNATESFDVKGLTAGVYFFTVGTTTEKVIIK